LWTRY